MNHRFDVNGKTVVLAGKTRLEALNDSNKHVRKAIMESVKKQSDPHWHTTKSVVIGQTR